jgi:2,4-dienoyl-CoA reductase-like NADH-dependent reductase (Old Yellow Enzyme family)
MEKSILLSPIKLGRRVSENRFAVHAIGGNNADSEGNPTEKAYRRYSRHFEGNAGVIYFEFITPDNEHRGRLNQLA